MNSYLGLLCTYVEWVCLIPTKARYLPAWQLVVICRRWNTGRYLRNTSMEVRHGKEGGRGDGCFDRYCSLSMTKAVVLDRDIDAYVLHKPPITDGRYNLITCLFVPMNYARRTYVLGTDISLAKPRRPGCQCQEVRRGPYQIT